MQDDLAEALHARGGHFRLESGHHGALWLELERLFMHPAAVAPLSARLAERIARCDVQRVCGPLIEGAFVALAVAEALGVPFTYADRVAGGRSEGEGLYPVRWKTRTPRDRSSLARPRAGEVRRGRSPRAVGGPRSHSTAGPGRPP